MGEPGPNGLLDRMMYTIADIRGLLPVVPHPTKDANITVPTRLEDAWIATCILDHDEWMAAKYQIYQTSLLPS